MRTLLCLTIAVLEFAALAKISGPRESIEEFLARCTPEQLYKAHCHGCMGMLALMMATISSAMEAQ